MGINLNLSNIARPASQTLLPLPAKVEMERQRHAHPLDVSVPGRNVLH